MNYLEQILKNRRTAADQTYDAMNIQNEQTQKSAYDMLNQKNRQAANIYAQSINPYGSNAEKLFSSGLTNTGVKNRSLMKTYGQYQNQLGQNSAELLSSLGQSQIEMLGTQNKRNAGYLEAENEYALNAYEEYLRQLELERQKEQDRIAREQWEKEFALRSR